MAQLDMADSPLGRGDGRPSQSVEMHGRTLSRLEMSALEGAHSETELIAAA